MNESVGNFVCTSYPIRINNGSIVVAFNAFSLCEMSERKDRVSELLAGAQETIGAAVAGAGDIKPMVRAGLTPETIARARQHTDSIRALAAGRTVATERLRALLRDDLGSDGPQAVSQYLKGLTDVLAALLGVDEPDAG